ncbi:Sugar kinase of the NBD/HSP70 family, may contain an N-terminal HTH domain [Granulicella rosea]|uniref:Sugar kinase of the NBD/HSP70 family, may contain an N-terminal HTH domain n=1 Tax=Granulicella rosea TaxID=474952 RepID=A0A239LTA5_9BACT|nr:ROK family protein [Granulicella rosea]SNT32874.1 Sugar kinase of the NBD/HSP70 family, may contain an N-terminal HTH domain [Granulicella rosea]
MAKTIGVVLSERIVAGLIVDYKLEGPLYTFPESEDDAYGLVELPTEDLVRRICEQIKRAAGDAGDLMAVGVALPGLIKQGVVEEAPNLPQLKGARIEERLKVELRNNGINVPVCVINDADGVAAGLAAHHEKLDSLIRVWTLGIGIGFGRYPFAPGVWEGGHTVVTLDDKERFCGCGGRGHMEGIMGQRAMRLRFLDMEPEEVFQAAKEGDPRCVEFKRLWHKALAAGIANSIHMDGTGKFFLTGFNVRFVDLPMLKDYLQQMVKMSPLMSYALEIVEDDAATRVIGAAVTALQAAGR